jgi:hypothetical protein
VRFSFGYEIKEVHGQVREGTTFQEWHLVRLSEGKRDCTARACTLNKISPQFFLITAAIDGYSPQC